MIGSIRIWSQKPLGGGGGLTSDLWCPSFDPTAWPSDRDSHDCCTLSSFVSYQVNFLTSRGKITVKPQSHEHEKQQKRKFLATNFMKKRTISARQRRIHKAANINLFIWPEKVQLHGTFLATFKVDNCSITSDFFYPFTQKQNKNNSGHKIGMKNTVTTRCNKIKLYPFSKWVKLRTDWSEQWKHLSCSPVTHEGTRNELPVKKAVPWNSTRVLLKIWKPLFGMTRHSLKALRSRQTIALPFATEKFVNQEWTPESVAKPIDTCSCQNLFSTFLPLSKSFRWLTLGKLRPLLWQTLPDTKILILERKPDNQKSWSISSLPRSNIFETKRSVSHPTQKDFALWEKTK